MCVIRHVFIVISSVLVTIHGENTIKETISPRNDVHLNPHDGLTEKIGNFTIELLYHTSKLKGGNLIMSPITAWTTLAVISEGAAKNTAAEINRALRIDRRDRNETRLEWQNIFRWLEVVNTSSVDCEKINAIFIDQNRLLLADFKELAKTVYQTDVIPLNFADTQNTADVVNRAISIHSHGKIPKLIDSTDLRDTLMILASALYFKGQWTVAFNKSSTRTRSFYNSSGQKTGEVKMMYNRYNYPFANMEAMEAKIIELPYGKEDRLSMLIMLPHPGVPLANMILNFANVSLDTVFSELKLSREEYGDEEVDCFIPRFKIESYLDLTDVLRNKFRIQDLLDERKARLPHMARSPLYVSKIVQKAEIEVTEEGITVPVVTAPEFSIYVGIVQFLANRPFYYMIVEKVTNSIVFGGIYDQPSIY